MGKLRNIKKEWEDIGWITVKILTKEYFNAHTTGHLHPKSVLYAELSDRFEDNPLVVFPKPYGLYYTICERSENMRLLLLADNNYKIQILVKNPKIFKLLYI